jgi:hypothetical protein
MLGGHQSSAGSQQFHDNDDLSALSATTLGQCAQSDRLAAGASMPSVDRSQLSAATEQTSAESSAESSAATEVTPTVFNLIKRYTESYMQQYGDTVSQHVESTLLRMNFCRTTALGSRTYRCDDCNYESTVFNSCGDRHGPNCSGAKRRDWMKSSTKLVVDGVTYFPSIPLDQYSRLSVS